MPKTKVEVLQKVRPKLVALEQERKKMLAARRKTEINALFLIIIGIGLVLALGLYLGKDRVTIPILGVVALMAVIYIYMNWKRLHVKDALQQTIGDVITEAMGGSWRYATEKHLSPSLVKYSGLVGRFRTIHGSNLVHGEHGDTRFSFSNINISNDGNDGRSDVFGGIMLAIDFSKDLKGRTLVFPDIAQQALGAWLGKTVQSFGWKGLELVYLEDPQFEKEFAVYSSDQVESRYILTPNMMSNMLRLKHKYGEAFSFSFTHGTVFVAIDKVPPFESALDAPILPDGTFYHFYKTIDLVTDIIDTLELNTRIWSKS